MTIELENLLPNLEQILSNFAQQTNFFTQMGLIFGTEANFTPLQQDWSTGNIILPKIELIESSDINNAQGAYAVETNTIYLSQELWNNGNIDEEIMPVLLEEYGHYLDSQLNISDTEGDEGQYFASVVLGETLTESQIANIKAENDTAVVNINGQNITIEQSTSVPSGDTRIDTILSGYKLDSTIISYSFFSGGAYYGLETGVATLSDTVKNSIRNILENVIEPLINVNFVEVSDSASSYGQIRYLLADIGEGYAYTYLPYPDQILISEGYNPNVASDIVFNKDWDLATTNTNSFQGTLGTHGYSTLIHETLHALGLKHPGDYNGNGTGTPPFLPFAEDNQDNTVMSYNFTANEPGTLMPYDLLGLQYLYGAKPLNSSDTIYSFSNVFRYSDGLQTVGSSTAPTKLTIWDSGGIDTLDFSAITFDSGGYRFDLNEGGWLTTQNAFNSSTYKALGDTSGINYFTTAYGTRLGYGVAIEKAIGTSSNDIFYGNTLNNSFSGKLGNDVFYGGDGNDTAIYTGTLAQYQISGTAGLFTIIDSLANRDGTDSLNSIEFAQFSDQIINLSTYNNLPSLYINDVVITEGNSGTTNAIFTVTRSGNASQPITVNYATTNGTAIAGSDFTNVTGTLTFAINETTKTISVPIIGDTTVESNETFFVNLSNATNAIIADAQGQGTINNDDTSTPPQVINGTSGSDILNGGSGNDTISGFGGMDIIDGKAGDDIINGGDDMDIIDGGLGNDTINGGLGNDNINGSLGNDTAVFSGNRSSYSITINGSGLQVTGPDGSDLISSIEFLKFNDQTISGLATPNIDLLVNSSTSILENGTDNFVYTFTRSDSFSNPLSSPFTINFSLSGTATLNTDYTQTGASFNGNTGTITFGANSTTATLILDPISDTIIEPNETITLTTSNNGSTYIVTTTIINDDIANQAPTNLTLSNNNISENQAIGTVIGNLTSSDPDTGNTFTYSLVSGTGSTDNSLFTIVNGQLQTNAIFDYETKNIYNIRVRTTDQGGLSYEKGLTIGVTNVNEIPTNLTLSNSNISENQAIGTVIGNLTSSDPDTGNTFTYSLVSGTGSTDNSFFTIVNGQLKTNAIFDYETKNSYSVLVRTTDQGGLYLDQQFTINITDINEIIGTTGNDNLIGSDNSDIQEGGTGSDIIQGSGGSDILDGGDGVDLADYTTSSTGITINLNTGIGTGGEAQGDTLISIEKLKGSNYDDHFIGSNDYNYFYAGDGDDILEGGTGGGFFYGQNGNDTLIGGANSDRLYGQNDHDILSGNGGNDIILGGTGDDILNGGSGNDQLLGDEGNDTLTGVDLTTFGRGEIDIVTGGNGADLFILGNTTNIFYDDGDITNQGKTDYARIKDFNKAEDIMQLKAGFNYYLGASPSGVATGTSIFIDNDGINGLSNKDELIANLEGLSFTYGQITTSTQGFTFV